MIEHHCDKVGCQETFVQEKGEREKLPEGWRRLSLTGYPPRPTFEVCLACAEKLGFATEEQEESLGDKLMDVITEMAEGAVENAMP